VVSISHDRLGARAPLPTLMLNFSLEYGSKGSKSMRQADDRNEMHESILVVIVIRLED